MFKKLIFVIILFFPALVNAQASSTERVYAFTFWEYSFEREHLLNRTFPQSIQVLQTGREDYDSSMSLADSIENEAEKIEAYKLINETYSNLRSNFDWNDWNDMKALIESYHAEKYILNSAAYDEALIKVKEDLISTPHTPEEEKAFWDQQHWHYANYSKRIKTSKDKWLNKLIE